MAVDLKIFPEDELGRTVEYGTIKHWITDRSWYQRKDELDAKFSVRAENELIAHKLLVVKEQLAQSRQIRHDAFLHLVENGFDSSAAASSAFFKASLEERILVGGLEIIEKLSKMQTTDIQQRMRELAERVESTAVDAVEVPDTEGE